MEPAESEATTAFGIRIQATAEELAEIGTSEEAIHLGIFVASAYRRIFSHFKSARTGLTFPAWAALELERGAYCSSPPLEAESHLLALARAAGWTKGRTSEEVVYLKQYLASLPESQTGTHTDATQSLTSTPQKESVRSGAVTPERRSRGRSPPERSTPQKLCPPCSGGGT